MNTNNVPDYVGIASHICTQLFTNTNEKTIQSIASMIEKANEEAKTDSQTMPIMFKDNTILTHPESPRYENGYLIRSFLDEEKLLPETAQKLHQLKDMLSNQNLQYMAALHPLLEAALTLVVKVPKNHQEIFLQFFPKYLWDDKDFIKSLKSGDVIMEMLSNNSLDATKAVDKFDTDSSIRNAVKTFVDTYYGLGLLDNF